MLPLLQGIRVLDFTTIVLGPYATQMLGDLGADVIKIESMQGDLFRTVRPGRSRSMGAGFMGFNRNKRSLAIDLKRPESRAVLARLVSGADAVVHNMRPKAAEPLGLTFEQLSRVKPDLVYAFAAGYDQSGPNANEPAYDDIIQAASGVAALNANTAINLETGIILRDNPLGRGGSFPGQAVLRGIVIIPRIDWLPRAVDIGSAPNA
jgi:crotonobetainyl-CoA:carnitine CoA-transferase CaiB-like acyl-CoA transferase